MRFPNISLRVQRRIAYVITAMGLMLGIWREDSLDSPPLGYGYVLDGIRDRGTLVVLTRNAPTTIYYDATSNLTGYEYDLIENFAEWLDVEPEYVILETVRDILDAVRRGEGDIAAAGLTRTEEREASYLFGPDYKRIQQQLVCNRNEGYPRRLSELSEYSIEVIADSSYEERLIELAAQLGGLTWQSTDALDTEGVLARVAAGQVDCTIADSNIVAINRRYEPSLIVPFDVSEDQFLAWVLPNGAINLRNAIGDWFDERQEGPFLSTLEERYYGHIDNFDFVDTRAFVQRVEDRLPEYLALFQEAAVVYGFNWTLLAAQAYQESHWNPLARSPTGVRGMMMLTLDAASDLGVTDRLDPEQSIMGGADYLAQLYRRLPDEVEGEDRVFFALAAYNVGYGHLRDAMTLAESRDLNPNSWRDMQTVLPLLARREHYTGLRYGYARGGEAVRYVQRIRSYWDILAREFPAHEQNQGSAFAPPSNEEGLSDD